MRNLPGVLLAMCGITACHPQSRLEQTPPPIVGAWLVKIPEVPFSQHMFIFHSDGTVMQSNPDAGDPNTSDSNLMGVWVANGDGVKGKLVEITADRTTHKFVSRGEISYSVKVNANAFTGKASALFYGPGEQQVRGPVEATLEGQRIVPLLSGSQGASPTP